MFDSLLFSLMLIGLLGIASQWIAWRYRLPAIVVMSIVGLIVGPFFNIVQPKEHFGDLFNPFISFAVAIILFEGSLNLDFREIKGVGKPLLRIVTLGAFLAWILGSLVAHYFAGLSWAVAFVIGGLFIVTGPTVILPLLRQAKLKHRPAAILKWEGIVVDPFGALLAAFAFQIIQFFTKVNVTATSLLIFFLSSMLAVVIGYFCAKFIAFVFEKGHVPEFLKSPLLLVIVLFCFSISDEIYHETGLLAVTTMGIVLANLHLASINEMRHFKENISVLLISTIFIMLTASLTMETLLDIFNLRIIAFVALMLFAVRPLSIFLSTIGTDLSLREKLLIGWIAPRGIVALTVSGYFANVLLNANYEGAEMLTSLTFALVFSTVILHGFSIGWLSKKLHLATEKVHGVLFVGGNVFTVELAKILDSLDIPVLITDNSWEHLIKARKAGIPTHIGEILSEQTDYQLNTSPYKYMVAATEMDSYNALICQTFAPDIGRKNLYQLPIHQNSGDILKSLHSSIGGQILFNNEATLEELTYRLEHGYELRKTTFTEQYLFDQFKKEMNPETILLVILKNNRDLVLIKEDMETSAEPGDIIVTLSPPNV